MSTGNDQIVLIVEDDAVIAMTESHILKKNGFSVLKADSAERAFDILEKQSVDLILMDIDLGPNKMTGTEAAEISLGRYDVPIVFCSSHTEKKIVEKVKGITRYGYVLKSAGEFVLTESINMALELFKSHKQLKKEIEERKQAESNLRENDARLRIINDISSDYAYCHKLKKDGSLEPVWHIGSFDHITGYTPEELYEKGGWETLIHPDDIPGAGRYLQDLLSGRPSEFTARIVTKSGKIRWIHDSARPRTDEESGKIIGTIGFAKDITSRKMVEDERERSEALYRNLMENSIDAVYLLSEEGKVLNVNNMACSMLGYSREELLERTIDDIDPNYPSQNFVSFWKDKPEGATILFESVHRKKNGEIFPVEVNGIFFVLNGVKYLFGVARDISERKKQERELSEKEENFRMLAENAGVGITMIHDGELKYVNSVAVEMSGFPRDEMLAADISEMIEHVHPDDRDSVVESYDMQKRHIASGNPERKIFPPTVYRHIRRNGETVWVEALVSIIKFNGKPALLVIHNDISNRKREEANLENLLAEKKLILKETHHRIKNNMDVIRNLILLQPDSPELTAGIVRSMMLLYDKLYRSEDYENLNASEFLTPLVEEIADIIGILRPIRVSIDVENINLGSKTLSSLGIIINELISNSRKYAFENIDDPLITITVSESEGGAKLVYEDNGPGFSTSESSEDNGGFGMHLVGLLVEQINGSLEVQADGRTRIIIRFGIS